MHIWMAMDRHAVDEGGAPWRILVSTRPLEDHDMPPGARGRNWERRERDVPDSVVEALLAGRLSPDSQDRIHRAWWTASGGEPWPG